MSRYRDRERHEKEVEVDECYHRILEKTAEGFEKIKEL